MAQALITRRLIENDKRGVDALLVVMSDIVELIERISESP